MSERFNSGLRGSDFPIASAVPQYFPEACESPIELKLSYELSKRLRPGATLVPQVVFHTRAGKFRADFVLHTAERNTVIECDGAEFHLDAQADMRRDLAILGSGLVQGVVRFSGQHITRSMHEIAYIVSLLHPEAFDERGHGLVRRLVPDSVSSITRQTFSQSVRCVQGFGYTVVWTMAAD